MVSRQVQVIARPLRQPVPDQLRRVRGSVVEYQVEGEFGRDILINEIEEMAELLAAVPPLACADHRAGLRIQGGEQVGRAVPDIVVRVPLHLARAHRQHRAVRSMACTCGFSSTHSTRARSGGLRCRPTMSLVGEQRVLGQLEVRLAHLGAAF
jgi:hypothetical protein